MCNAPNSGDTILDIYFSYNTEAIMNNITEHEIARIKKDGKKVSKTMKNTPLHHRGYLFTSMAHEFDRMGEKPLAALFYKIAGSYIRKKAE